MQIKDLILRIVRTPERSAIIFAILRFQIRIISDY